MKKRRANLLCLAVVLLLSFYGCSKEDERGDPGSSDVKATVYSVGYYYINEKYYPCYWRDSVMQKFPVPEEGWYDLTSIAVSGGKTYIAGNYKKNNLDYQAFYSVDGEITYLPLPEVGYPGCRSMVVSGGKVYVAGKCWYDPCYWVDGEIQFLPVSPNGPSNVTAITVSGNDVCVGGQFNNKPCYWLNGVFVELSMPDRTTGACIAVAMENGKIYAAGFVENRSNINACYWVDGVRTDLVPIDRWGRTCQSTANSMVVSGGKVYVAGDYNYFYPIACYWVDGVLQKLPFSKCASSSSCKSIAVVDGKVYATGSYVFKNKKLACYWADGRCVDFEVPENLWSDSQSVAIEWK